ncbi:tyrosine-type recombinase/integrase [Streptomyces antimycoticus]
MGLRDQAGNRMRYTPHDFRRMFATEAVTGRLPVHIAARILGHKTLTTTQAYLAVFQDDLIRTYRGSLDRRRAERPVEEYREPTEQEWSDYVSARPAPTAGWEKSKDSRSASPPPPPSCTASSAPQPTAGHSWSTWACPSSPTTHRRPNRMREDPGLKADH